MGESVCKGCSLVIRLDFRDDLCPGCGYDMRGTPATTCAECGRARQMPHATAC
jgi:predicted amidophosphoribosyltransferase